MSGVEVLGAITAVIGILESSIKVYDSVKRDKKLPETLKIVRSRMPVILDTLQKCAKKLRPNEHSMPTDICDALENILFACEEKAETLEKIFKNVIPAEADSWERYLKVVRRVGKGKQVEELMEALTKDVQLLVNHDAVSSATPEQNDQLEHIVEEMQSLRSSIAEEQHQPLRFESGGGAQTNNVNSGSGQQINNNGHVGAQNFLSVTIGSSEYENEEESAWASDVSDESAASYRSSIKCFNCKGYGHIQYDCPVERACDNCGYLGHDKEDCTRRDGYCYKCGIWGHHATTCMVPRHKWRR